VTDTDKHSSLLTYGIN